MKRMDSVAAEVIGQRSGDTESGQRDMLNEASQRNIPSETGKSGKIYEALDRRLRRAPSVRDKCMIAKM